MEWAGAILYRDLVVRPRQRFFYSQRLGVMLLAALPVGVMHYFGHDPTKPLGLLLFIAMTYPILLLLCVYPTYLTASAMWREIREGTLETVLLSDIDFTIWLRGCYFSGLLQNGLTLAALLPLSFYAVNCGGIGYTQITLAVALMGCLIHLTVCVGIAVGLAPNKRKGGQWVNPLLQLFISIPLASVIRYIWPAFFILPFFIMTQNVWIVAICLLIWSMTSPFFALSAILLNPMTGVISVLGCCGLMIYAGRYYWNKACLLDPLVLLNMEQRKAEPRERTLSAHAMRIVRKRQPLGNGNPVTWKDLLWDYGFHPSELVINKYDYFVIYAFCATTMGVFTGFTASAGKSIWTVAQHVYWLCPAPLTPILAFVVFWDLLHKASQCFYFERRRRTLESLIVTRMSERELINGKINAILRSIRPAIIGLGTAYLLVLIGYMFKYDQWSTRWNPVALGLQYGAALYAYFFLTLEQSLRCLKDRAMTTALFLLAIWAVLDQFFVMADWPHAFLVALHVVFHAVLGYVSRQILYGRFRSLAGRMASKA